MRGGTGELMCIQRARGKRCKKRHHSVEESKNLSTSLSATGLLMVHDAISGCEHQEPELTRGQQVVGPGLDLVQLHGETGADNTTLVQAAIQGHDDFPGTVVIDDLELINVPVLLHGLQESNNDLGAGSQQNLTLAALLGVANGLEGVMENRHTHHGELGGFSGANGRGLKGGKDGRDTRPSLCCR